MLIATKDTRKRLEIKCPQICSGRMFQENCLDCIFKSFLILQRLKKDVDVIVWGGGDYKKKEISIRKLKELWGTYFEKYYIKVVELLSDDFIALNPIRTFKYAKDNFSRIKGGAMYKILSQIGEDCEFLFEYIDRIENKKDKDSFLYLKEKLNIISYTPQITHIPETQKEKGGGGTGEEIKEKAKSKRENIEERKIKEEDLTPPNEEEIIIDEYITEAKPLYKIKIIKLKNRRESFYKWTYNIKTYPKKKIKKLINSFALRVGDIKVQKKRRVDHLLYHYAERAMDLIKSKENLLQKKGLKSLLEEETLKILSLLIAIKKINMETLFPYYVDDKVEEIMVDQPSSMIYLDHQSGGRCITEDVFTEEDISRFKTFVRLYSSRRLDFSNPSLQMTINNDLFFIRIKVDVAPVQADGFAFSIRKLSRDPFTIQDLLKFETLTPSMASFLYFTVVKLRNITTVGETNTGKTTLINCFDMLVPRGLREVIVESALESLDLNKKFGHHQVRVNTDDETAQVVKFTKSSQIPDILHKNPEVLYLGEILTKEQVLGLFHFLSLGLRGFQTIHCENVESLLIRLLDTFNIKRSSIRLLDLVLLMKRQQRSQEGGGKTRKQIRRVFSISEFDKARIPSRDTDMRDLIRDVFRYDPETKEFKQCIELYDTYLVKEIKKEEALSKELFNNIIETLTDFFKFLKEAPRLGWGILVPIFHILSYSLLNENMEKFKEKVLKAKKEIDKRRKN